MKLTSALFSIAIVLMSPAAAVAHGGGLDSQGCHHNRKAGGYHCHRGPMAGQSFQSKSEATRAQGRRVEPVAPRSIVGKAQIVDGNTIEVGGQRINLFGIDAPAPGQFCDAGGKKWPCGQNAVFGLSAIVERQWVHCQARSPATAKVVTAVCRLAGADGPDINAAMVRQGWARADGRMPAYLSEEKTARAAKAGIWAGQR